MGWIEEEEARRKSEKITVSVIIPAYNETEGIGQVVSDLHRVLGAAPNISDFEILVIDDCSEDDTADRAKAAGARLLRHPSNVGYGKALLTGFAAAQYDYILMIDGDGSYPPDGVKAVLANGANFDMTIGARKGSFFWCSPLRSLLRRIYLMMASFVAGYSIPDANSGLRLIRKEAIRNSMPVICLGYSFSTTMTLSFLQAGRFVRFFPINYIARKGHSKVSMPRDIMRTMQIMTQVILHYNPLKFCVALACIPTLMAVGFAVRFACNRATLDLAMATVCLLSTLFVFLVGCHIDSQRIAAQMVARAWFRRSSRP